MNFSAVNLKGKTNNLFQHVALVGLSNLNSGRPNLKQEQFNDTGYTAVIHHTGTIPNLNVKIQSGRI